MKQNQLWTLTKILVGIMIVLTFTVLTPAGKHQPELGGMPYVLWVNILSAIVLVCLTWFGTKVHPSNNESEIENN